MEVLELALRADWHLGRGRLLILRSDLLPLCLELRGGLLLNARGGLLLEQRNRLLLALRGGLLLDYGGSLPLKLLPELRGGLLLDIRGGLLQNLGCSLLLELRESLLLGLRDSLLLELRDSLLLELRGSLTVLLLFLMMRGRDVFVFVLHMVAQHAGIWSCVVTACALNWHQVLENFRNLYFQGTQGIISCYEFRVNFIVLFC